MRAAIRILEKELKEYKQQASRSEELIKTCSPDLKKIFKNGLRSDRMAIRQIELAIRILKQNKL